VHNLAAMALRAGSVALLSTLLACGGAAPTAAHVPAPSGPATAYGPAPSGLAPPRPPGPSSPQVVLGAPVDADPSDDVLLDHGQYVLSYHPGRHVANWVAWRLDRDDLGQAPRHDAFRVDPDLPFGLYRVTPRDYVRSGYDRGHLCPSADRTRGEAENAVTFLMTNVHPQLHELNAGPWEQLEVYARDLARAEQVSLYIVAGGVFADPSLTIGNDVAVPTASYKVVCVLGRGQTAADLTSASTVFAVKIPNVQGVGGHSWTEFLVTVDEVERASGYDFMPGIAQPLQEELESRPVAASRFQSALARAAR
jgi:endonuclease G